MSKEIRNQVIDKLDVRALGLITFMTIVEFEIFTYARGVVKVAEQDAWISILIGTVFLVLNAYIMVLLANRYPRENFWEYCPKVWGKTLGFLIQIAYMLYWFATLVIIFEDFSIANEAVFLPKTPEIIPIALLALGAYWIVCYGFTAVVRFLQLMFLFLFIPLTLIAILGFGQIQLDNFQPILGHNLGTILKGAIVFTGIYQGLEVILFAGPFLTNVKKMAWPAIIGAIGGTFFPLILSISAIGSLGVQNLKQSIWPGVDTVSMIMLPGFPVERYELFLTMPWIIALFTTICMILYLLAYGIKETFHLEHRKRIVGLSVVLVVAATFLFPDYAWALKYREILTLATYLFIAILPLLTLILAMVRGKGEVQ